MNIYEEAYKDFMSWILDKYKDTDYIINRDEYKDKKLELPIPFQKSNDMFQYLHHTLEYNLVHHTIHDFETLENVFDYENDTTAFITKDGQTVPKEFIENYVKVLVATSFINISYQENLNTGHHLEELLIETVRKSYRICEEFKYLDIKFDCHQTYVYSDKEVVTYTIKEMITNKCTDIFTEHMEAYIKGFSKHPSTKELSRRLKKSTGQNEKYENLMSKDEFQMLFNDIVEEDILKNLMYISTLGNRNLILLRRVF